MTRDREGIVHIQDQLSLLRQRLGRERERADSLLESYTQSVSTVEGENADDIRSVRSLSFDEVLTRHPLWIRAERNANADGARPSSIILAQPGDHPTLPVVQSTSSNGNNAGHRRGSIGSPGQRLIPPPSHFVLSVETAVVGDDGSMQFHDRREELNLKFNEEV